MGGVAPSVRWKYDGIGQRGADDEQETRDRLYVRVAVHIRMLSTMELRYFSVGTRICRDSDVQSSCLSNIIPTLESPGCCGVLHALVRVSVIRPITCTHRYWRDLDPEIACKSFVPGSISSSSIARWLHHILSLAEVQRSFLAVCCPVMIVELSTDTISQRRQRSSGWEWHQETTEIVAL